MNTITANIKDSFTKSFFYPIVNFFFAIPENLLYFLLFISLIVIQYYNFNINPDLAIQLNCLINFSNGHGISLANLNSNYQLFYTTCSSWPAGLVIFMFPLFFITKSVIISVLLLNSISYTFYILFLNKFLNYLSVNSIKRKLIILFLIVSIAPFIHFYPSDALATVICLWGFYYNIKFQNTGKVSFLIFSVFLIGATYFIKYSFLPFVFYPFVSFLLKERRLLFQKIKESVLIFLLCLIILLLFYFLNLSLVGQKDVGFATHLDLLHSKAHWNQLSRFDGFLFTFGIYEWVIENFFKNHLTLNIQFNWVSILVTAYFYCLFLKVFFLKKTTYHAHFRDSINFSLSAGGLISAFLIFLSLNNPGQTWAKPYWTFVEESRYYGPVIVIGIINILVIFLEEKKGLMVHFLVPLMIVFNLFAYRTIIQLGFWGNNYRSYQATKSKIYEQYHENQDKKSIFYYENEMKNSMPYLILESEGEVLIKKDSSNQKLRNGKYLFLNLKADSSVGFKINLIN